MEPADEADLMDRCRAGSTAAWDQLFDLHYGPMVRYVACLIPDAVREDIDEVCQDAFLAAIRNLGAFRGGSRFQTWLFRIAANKAGDFRDRRLAAKRGGGRVAVPLDVEDPRTGRKPEPVAHGASPSERVIEEEAMREVRRCLDQLGGACREILELRYFGDLDCATIGSELGLHARTVSSRLGRCLARLGDLLRRARMADEPTARAVRTQAIG